MGSIATRKRDGKPLKPSPDFPLFAHATRRWAKKIRGKLHYFGPWDDPDAALQRYVDQRDDLHAGRTPRVSSDGLTVRDLLNRFLTSKQRFQESGEITGRTFREYRATCERIADAFGLNRLVDDLGSDDFESLRADMARCWGPVTLGNEVQRMRVVFKYAYDAGLIDRPVRLGPNFKRPSTRILRRHRAEKGPRMFESNELRAMLEVVKGQLRTMILLGINCGFGNQDVGTLPMTALDLDGGWVSYARPKTGIARRCPLWAETVAALGPTIVRRRTPKDEGLARLVFITKYGASWVKDNSDRPVSKEMTKVLKQLGIHRPGVGFYALRHTFETIGGETRDQVAVDHIMGHARDDMASLYRERISDERLVAVTDYVRNWLFSDAPTVKRIQ